MTSQTLRKRRLPSIRTSRKKSHLNPSTEYILSNVSKDAKYNKILLNKIRSLCQIEMNKSKHERSKYYASRLRQFLILLTGADANGELFVNTNDGKMHNPDIIYKITAELIQPYRIEGGPGWSRFQRSLKLIRQLCNQLLNSKYILVGVTDLYLTYLIATFGVYRPVRAILSLKQQLYSHSKDMKSILEHVKTHRKNIYYNTKSSNLLQILKSFSISISSLFALLMLFGSPAALKVIMLVSRGDFTDKHLYASVLSLPKSGIVHLRKGFYHLMDGATLHEFLINDGVNHSTLVKMRLVSDALVKLDKAVQKATNQDLIYKLTVLQTNKRNTPYMWMDKEKEESLIKWLEIGIANHDTQSLSKYRCKLMEYAPRTQGFHFCTNYGDVRNTARSIAGAYILFAYQQWQLWEGGITTLPKVGNPGSIKAAKRAVLNES